MIKNLFKNIDFILLICIIALSIIGIVGIYSAGYSSDVNRDEYIKQLIFFGIGMLVMITLIVIPSSIIEISGYLIYIVNLVLLVAVLFTAKLMGANSWFNLGGILYQPSELMKIGYILSFAKVLSIYKKQSGMNKTKRVICGIIMFSLFVFPVTLILLQPDFGTAVVFLVITLFMLFKSGLKYRYILIGIAILLICMPLAYYFVLNDVQRARIDVYLDPTLDPLGSGYNAIQSQLAVGSGMLIGTGLLKGVQTQLGYIPIKTSDFIFSVLSEELGFVMSFTIIVLFVIMIIRLIIDSKNTFDEYYSLVAIGITGMIFFHFVQNIGMTIGFLPITGVPLPFVSYGGSSMLTNCFAMGIIFNICARRKKSFLF